MPDLLRTERLDNGVVVVTLDSPPVNALSRGLLVELAGVAEGLALDSDVKAVVLCAAGKMFAAGADISEFGGPEEARAATQAFRVAGDTLGAIPRPTIAALHGAALGGGLEIALACDLRVALDSTKLGQPEILLGLIPGGGGSQRLSRLIGPARTKEIVWSGRQLRAAGALELGIVDRIVERPGGDSDTTPADAVREAAVEWASELASGPVVAMGLVKQAIDAGLDGSLAEGLDHESNAFVKVFDTEDAATGVASFLQHGPGKAEFRGR